MLIALETQIRVNNFNFHNVNGSILTWNNDCAIMLSATKPQDPSIKCARCSIWVKGILGKGHSLETDQTELGSDYT